LILTADYKRQQTNKQTTLSLSGWHAIAVMLLSLAMFWNHGRFPMLVQLKDSFMAGLPEIALPLKDQKETFMKKVFPKIAFIYV